MGRFLGAVGAFCVRFRWPVVAIWLIAAFGLTALTNSLGPTTNDNVNLPGTDSQAATDLLTAEFPPQQNGSNPAVYHVTKGRLDDDGPNEAAIKQALKTLRADPDVFSITNPFKNPQGGLISEDRRYVFMPFVLTVNASELAEEKAEHLYRMATEPTDKLGIESAVGGSVGSVLSSPDTGSSEKLGILAAAVILAFTFGSLVAMGLPLLSSVIGLLLGLISIWGLGLLADIPSIGITLARMIGLGVGIDYALFLVSRHRRYVMADDLRPGDAAARAVATSGGAIVFAGGTVVIALLSLQVAGIPFIAGLGWACATAVATAVLAAITFLPAVLAIIGNGITKVRLPLVGRSTAHPIAARWTGLVTSHPWITTAVAFALMVPLVVPATTLVLGQEDLAVGPQGSSEREAFDLISAGFGPGYNGPLLIATQMHPAAKPSKQYTKQYNQALDLQSELEQASKSLPQQKKELEQQQEILEQEGAQLQAEGADLQAEQASLEAQAAQLLQEKDALTAAADQLKAKGERLATRGRRLLANERELGRKVAANTARAEILKERIANGMDPVDHRRLQRRLAEVEDRGKQLRKELKQNTKALERVAEQGRKLLDQAARLEEEAAGLAAQGSQLEQEGAELQAQALALQEQQASLEAQAQSLQEWGDELQQQADEAKKEQKQAEELQAELTKKLTKAGGDPRGTDPRIVTLQNALATPDDVDFVAPPQINDDGTAVIMSVIPNTRPADPLTADLVEVERSDVIPTAIEPGMETHVGGSTASNVDLATLISQKLGLVILTVILLSSLLLLIAFRSLLIPVEAAIANLLAAGAAFGLVTWIFQGGNGLDQIGLDSPYGTVPVASYVPLMMFAALFGLSMDYQVFVMSTIQGEVASGLEPRDAVRKGLTESAKIIVSAALIMMSVFGSFILNDDPIVKQFGVGLTCAVGLAGFLVLFLAPALLMVFNHAAWRLPGFLDRILPDLDLEGRALERRLKEHADPDVTVLVAGQE